MVILNCHKKYSKVCTGANLNRLVDRQQVSVGIVVREGGERGVGLEDN